MKALKESQRRESPTAAAVARDSVVVAGGGGAADGAGGFEGAKTTVSERLAQKVQRLFRDHDKHVLPLPYSDLKKEVLAIVSEAEHRLVDAQQQLEGLKEVISRLIDETYEKEGEIIKRGNQIEELEGRLQRIRDLVDEYSSMCTSEKLMNAGIYLKQINTELAVVQGDGAAETEKILEAWTKGSKASPYVPLGEGEGDNP